MQDRKMTDKVARVENAGLEIDGQKLYRGWKMTDTVLKDS